MVESIKYVNCHLTHYALIAIFESDKEDKAQRFEALL